ncbi:FKBP-type peptidyl-prolyl cis-trans isomerase, partial [Erythrobacter sp. HI0019]
MTEITRVPLQPIKKGSLTKLWLGVLLAVLVAAGLAWAAMPRGLDVETVTAGSGDSPQLGDVVFVNYVGTLADGTEFDR